MPYDYDKMGESHVHAHPDRLPPGHKLVPVALFGSESDHLQHAQRTWSQIIHHGAWHSMWQRLANVSAREAVRFVAVSQPHAGMRGRGSMRCRPTHPSASKRRVRPEYLLLLLFW